jgi:hypothetical protein
MDASGLFRAVSQDDIGAVEKLLVASGGQPRPHSNHSMSSSFGKQGTTRNRRLSSSADVLNCRNGLGQTVSTSTSSRSLAPCPTDIVYADSRFTLHAREIGWLCYKHSQKM